VKEGITNIRLGMFLELATTVGAIIGAWMATWLSTSIIAILFGAILILSAILSFVRLADPAVTGKPGSLSQRLRLNSSFPTAEGEQPYFVKHVIGGFFMMNIAGIISGLLGIGSGALKVIAMDNVMRVPFKVSTTTSNFMIGVTAAASVGIYLKRGYIDPSLSMPVVLGVLAGAFAGSKILTTARTTRLKTLFAFVILVLAAEMIYNGFVHNI